MNSDLTLTRRGALAGVAAGLAGGAVAACSGSGAVGAVPASHLPAPAGTGEQWLAPQTQWTLPPVVVPMREGLAALPGTRLWFQDSGGSGEAVVLCHAWTGSYAVWGYQQRALIDAGYRVIAYSMRGHYRSDPVDPAAPGTVTADLAALLDHLAITRAHMVGSAGGALPAVEYALDYPDRTLSLTVASGHMDISDAAFVAAGRRMFPPGVYNVSHAFSEIGPSYRAGFPAGVAEWERLEKGAWQGGATHQTTDRPITFARLANARPPIMLITGGADLMMPPSRMREVAGKVPVERLVFVPEAGHSLFWEQPEAFNRALLAFLLRHSGRAKG